MFMFVILLIINKIAIKSLQSKILKNSLGFKLKLVLYAVVTLLRPEIFLL